MAKPELSVVVSALNEEKTVRSVLEQILRVFDNYKINGEIIFMDNHSTDRTGILADKAAKKDKRARVIHRINRPNTDLGSSLREGFANARGKYLIIMDCDLSHSPDEIPNLLKHKNEADIIIGSRYTKGGKADMSLKRSIISRSFNLMTKIIAGTNVNDITTGFKLYKKEVLDKLKLTSTGFGLHVEIFLKAINKGCKAIEVPIHYQRADKKSTLNYRKQFLSYAKPVLSALKEKYFG
ncbi:glycosyltransferase [Candidatus Woesearchaeota archaeon]|nr:glycosyltransferase [Candidatus Woesearchaeota archaeon]